LTEAGKVSKEGNGNDQRQATVEKLVNFFHRQYQPYGGLIGEPAQPKLHSGGLLGGPAQPPLVSWEIISLNVGESFVGIQATNNNNLKDLGFVIINPGKIL